MFDPRPGAIRSNSSGCGQDALPFRFADLASCTIWVEIESAEPKVGELGLWLQLSETRCSLVAYPAPADMMHSGGCGLRQFTVQSGDSAVLCANSLCGYGGCRARNLSFERCLQLKTESSHHPTPAACGKNSAAPGARTREHLGQLACSPAPQAQTSPSRNSSDGR